MSNSSLSCLRVISPNRSSPRNVGSLPWLSAMVGLPWTAHGVVCSFYLNMAKSDHREGGITFEAAKASNFGNQDPDSDIPAG